MGEVGERGRDGSNRGVGCKENSYIMKNNNKYEIYVKIRQKYIVFKEGKKDTNIK